MKSLFKQHETWLSDYQNSIFFYCEDREEGCGIFHLLTPILHDIGILQSYGSYSEEIQKIVSKVVFDLEKVNILVVGIDSESSARALNSALSVFEGRYIITFIDRCPTPLMRIQEALDVNERKYISIQEIDIFSVEAKQLYSRFDIIFSDSFVKQFSKPQKVRALKFLKKAAKNSNSLIVIREYIGNLKELLNRLWQRLDPILAQDKFNLFTSSSNKKKFYALIESLDLYYKKTGEIYSNVGELYADLLLVELKIIEEFVSEMRADRIIVAKKDEL